MDVQDCALPGVKLLRPRRFADPRGFFVETYNQARLKDLTGFADAFVQDNLSHSVQPGTIRGLHFQIPPFAQAKLVMVLAGRILDVAVDIRHGSPGFGRHVAVELDAERGDQLLVPTGFAHGFCTLLPGTTVAYKVTAPYAPSHDAGLLWSDPALDIAWPVAPEAATLSDRDRAWPCLAALPRHFTGA